MRLRLEADAERDLNDRHLRFRQQSFGALDALLRDLVMRPQPRRPTKQRREMHSA
jgi:hypothetical protein